MTTEPLDPETAMPLSCAWLETLARYNRWMNQKVYQAASQLPDELRRRDLGAFFKSIHGSLNHLLIADRIWLSRLEGTQLPEGDIGPGGIRSLDQDLFPDFDTLCNERAQTDEALISHVVGLSFEPESLTQTQTLRRRGGEVEVPGWWALAQVFNHQTHHRGQVTTLLTQQGVDVGVTDLFVFLMAERQHNAS